MGNSGSAVSSSISDLFYPDNPKRRERARQLQIDCENFINAFNTEKSTSNNMEPVVRERMNQYLKKHGFNTLAELTAHVNGVLNGEALKKWQDLQKELSGTHFLEEACLTISGLIASATGIVAGGLVLLAIISGPVGWAVFAGVSLVMAVVAAVVIVFAVIEGAEERRKLRESIADLAFARVDVKQQLERLRVINNWNSMFSEWFSNEWYELSPDIFEKHFGQQFRADMAKVDRAHIIADLRSWDDSRSAWRDEDPDVTNPRPQVNAMMMMASAEVAVPEMSLKPTSKIEVVKDGSSVVMDLTLQSVQSVTECTAIDLAKKETWKMNAIVAKSDATVHTLANTRFDFVNLATDPLNLARQPRAPGTRYWSQKSDMHTIGYGKLLKNINYTTDMIIQYGASGDRRPFDWKYFPYRRANYLYTPYMRMCRYLPP